MDWDVHWGYDLAFDPWPYERRRAKKKNERHCRSKGHNPLLSQGANNLGLSQTRGAGPKDWWLPSLKIAPIRVPLFDYPKIDLNPGVLLLGGMNHPWV